MIDIDRGQLPSIMEVDDWTGKEFAQAVTHDQACPAYNPHMRQLLHVGYKVAAELGQNYLGALEANETAVGACVTANILDRHIKPIFL